MNANGRPLAVLVVAISGVFVGLCFLGASVYAVCQRWPGLCNVFIGVGCVLFAAAVALCLLIAAAFFHICARARRLRRARGPAVDGVGADGFLRFRVRI